MALVKFGGGVIQMSGSIAGNTFAKNRFGNYVRARTKPINPRSPMQGVVRSILSDLTDIWGQDLSAVERTAWNLYASSVAMKNKLGEVVYLSGFNHFIRSNSCRLRASQSTIKPGPTNFVLPPADPAMAITASAAGQSISLAFNAAMNWCKVTGSFLHLSMGQPQNPQKNFFNGPWKSAGALQGNTAVPITSPQVIPVVFAIALGQRIWMAARIQEVDGRLSELFRDDCFVGA